jgi:hypothetical protein
MDAALRSGVVTRGFMSTDDPALMDLATTTGFEVVERPAELCSNTALGEHAYRHGLQVIRERLGVEPELLVLLFCNAATVSPAQIVEGVEALRRDSTIDSAVTVSRYNMWSPLRARQRDGEGLLQPFVPFEIFGDPKTLNCDRDSQGDVWFADVALSVIRPGNLDALDDGLLPQKWMGRRIWPILNEAGLDVDYEWQLGQVEWWLKKHGRVPAGA